MADRLLEDVDDLSDPDREVLRAELLGLLATKRERLEALTRALRSEQSELGEQEDTQKELLKTTRELTTLLDEQLIWIHNVSVLGLSALADLDEDLDYFVDADKLSSLVDALGRDLRGNMALYIAVLLGLVALWSVQRSLGRRVEEISARVRRIREDRYLLTLRSLAITLALSVAVPALPAFVGWRIRAASGGSEISAVVSAGLLTFSWVVFVIQLLRQLARPSGLGEAHFRWNASSTRKARLELLWYLPVAALGGLVIAATGEIVDPVYGQRSGRIAFILVMIATSVLAWRLFRPGAGLGLELRHGLGARAIVRARRLWHPAVTTTPLVLAGMSVAGYSYMAEQFGVRIIATVLWILGAILIFSLCYRWLVLSQRRLAIKIAEEKRQARARSLEAEGLEESPEGLVDMLEEIDVAEIKEQTLDLLNVALAILLFFGLWAAWAGVIPAFRILDQFTLWSYTATVAGQETLLPITAANALTALVFLVLTIVAARNMPGLLEITVLQRLPLDPGTRYATRTLILYSIVAIGLVLTFNSLRIGWSSVQWLLAALTVGLGFGLQEIFANFVSGLIILLERPIRVGDTVTVGEISGVVTRIRMRATTIMDWNRKELIVPNKSFITGELINWSLSDPTLRIDFLVGIAYGSDTLKAQEVMLEVCRQHPQVLGQPEPNVFFTSFGANSLDFEVRVFVAEQTNVGRTRIVHDLHTGIDRACRDHGITIAFPQRDLHIKSSEAVLRVENVAPEAPRPGEAEV